MLETMLEVLGVALIAAGLTLATLGLYGLLRMRDIYAQLHAAGLVTGPAVIAILLAAFATAHAEIVTSAVLVALFVLITAPLSSHAIARAHHGRDAAGSEAEERRPVPRTR